MISLQCHRGAHHLCRPDMTPCSCPCGRNGHPSDDYGPDGPGDAEVDQWEREEIGFYDEEAAYARVAQGAHDYYEIRRTG